MAVQRYPMPNVLSPVIDMKTGRMTPTWVGYFKGLEEVAGRVSSNQATVPGGATLGNLITAFNALNVAAQAASQQDTP